MSAQSDVDAIFKDLDSLPNPSAPPASRAPQKNTSDSQAIQALAELDDLASTPAKPRLNPSVGTNISRPSSRATERVSLSSLKAKNAAAAAAEPPAARSGTPPIAPIPSAPSAGSGSGWGWGSVWSSASAAVQQAKAVVEEQAKNLPNVPQVEQTKQWRDGLVGYVKNAQLDKITNDLRAVSLSTFNDILNVVAPPIAEHEVIQVWLSHDLEGYDGVETLVYRALARILEQVEGGDLVVNKGNESRQKDQSGEVKRELNAVQSFETALKLSRANIDDLDKPGLKSASDSHPAPATSDSLQNPTTYTTVYLRIQPYFAPSPFPPSSSSSTTTSPSLQLQFLLQLRDPSHSLDMSTLTQALPAKWMDLWDTHDWVEDQLAEALRLGVEMLGQEYVVARMNWGAGASGINTPTKERDGKEGSVGAMDTDGEFEKVDA